MNHRRLFSWTAAALLAALVLAAAIGCKQNGDTDDEQPQPGLTLKGTEAGAAYAVRVYPAPKEDAVSFEAWTEATADKKLAAKGEAASEGAEVLVSLSVPDTEDGNAFTGTGSFLVLVTAGEETRYATAAFLDGSTALELANMKEPPGNPDYGISLSETETLVFASANEGYADRTAAAITVTNIGHQPTGSLTLALSGNNSGSFTLSLSSIASIAADGTAEFTVVPNTGLKAGLYTATVSVTGKKIAVKSFGVSFSVNNKDGTPPENPDAPKPDYRISLSQTETLVFGEEFAGYDALTPQTITISNTGAKATGRLTVALSGANSGAFTRLPASIASIAANGSATFTVVPKTGQKAGTYAATVTVSGNNGISEGFDVGFTVNVVPVYRVELSRTGTLAFDDAVFGYPPLTPQSITIYNRGNQPTGALAIALAGDNASAFTLSKTAIEEGLAPDGEADFTVVPNDGLDAGPHTATVTVSGSNGGTGAPITAGFEVSFNVIAGTFGIELDVSGTHNFPDAILGYSALTAKKVNITNKGNQPTGGLAVTLTGDNASAFTASPSTVSGIAAGDAGGTGSFTIAPIDGLGEGTYTATVTVTGGNGGASAPITAGFGVSFTVTATYGIRLSRTKPYAFTPAIYGYGEQAVMTVTVTNTGDQPTGGLTVSAGTDFEITAPENGAVNSIPIGGEAAFSVRPRTGLEAGPHGATVTVSGANIEEQSFGVSFEVEAATFGVALNQTTPHSFGAVTLPDYAEPAALSVTVINTGNQPTGTLAVALTGDDASSFTASPATITDIAAGGTAAFTVVPNGGLTLDKTYEATVRVTGGNDGASAPITAEFAVSFEVKPVPVYGIALSQTAAHQFGAVTLPNYTQPAALSVTVTNSGNQPTGALTVALSGSESGSFTRSSATVESIAAGGTGSFTVAPAPGLAEGTHTATVTVSGGSTIEARSFGVSFTVNPVPVYGIALSKTGTHQFSAVTLPAYPQRTPLSVTVTNSGNQPTGDLTVALSGANGGSFTRSPATVASIAAGGSGSFTVVPNSSLLAGTHVATVTVSGIGGTGASNIEARSFDVSFTVNPAPSYNINLSQMTAYEFPSAAFDYEAQTAKRVTITNTGNQPTGSLSIALSGTNSGAFTRSPATVASLAAGGTAAFTVVPNIGLEVGTYTATVTVIGDNSGASVPITASFDVSFTVTLPPSYLTLADGAIVRLRPSDLAAICTRSPINGDINIPINGQDVSKNSIKKVVIGSDFSSVTALPEYFCHRLINLAEIDLSGFTGLVSIGDRFMEDCLKFNNTLTLPAITSIADYFMIGCKAFNKPLVLPSSTRSIGSYFLSSSFTALAFNNTITLPEGLLSIGDALLSNYPGNGPVYNKPLTIPSTVTHVGKKFLIDCTQMTSTITILCPATAFEANNASFSTTNNTSPSYTTGIRIAGPNTAAIMARFPNGSLGTPAYHHRKLIAAQ